MEVASLIVGVLSLAISIAGILCSYFFWSNTKEAILKDKALKQNEKQLFEIANKILRGEASFTDFQKLVLERAQIDPYASNPFQK